MSTEMGPVESALRFGVVVVFAIVLIGAFSQWILAIDGPLWPIAVILLIGVVMILLSYERTFGW